MGPPSPYGPPPSELAGAGAAPSPYDAPKYSPYEAPQQVAPALPSYDAPQAPVPVAPSVAPPAAPVTPAASAASAASSASPEGYAPQTAVFAAEQPPAYGQASTPAQPPASQLSDPFAVPVTPAYASPHPQPGTPGGPGGPVWGAPVPAGPPSNGGGGGKRRGIGGLVAAVLVAALVAGGVGGGVGYEIAHHNIDNSGSTTVSAPNNTKALNRSPTSVAGIANKALPSVVTIKASGSQESGTGTGFVFDTQGHILTNNHVVAPAADGGKLTVTFSNGNTYDASVVGRAQGYDVAVVKLKNAGNLKLTPLPLGNSDDSAVGDTTIAIGAPFGLSGTVTTGIVSAVHRPVASSDGQGSSASYMSAIQTDASINPGNSGGPLLNANGAVIGINSAIQPAGNSEPGSQGGSVGLGFAIPINQAKRVANQLIKTGQPVYPLIGVSLDTQYDGDGAKISTTSGAITAGGPGDTAGLKAGDIITKFDDTLIDSGQTLIGEIWQHQPGDKATITYTRGGSAHTTDVTLGSRTGDSDN
ncbi:MULTISPECIES: S1C family serine protease [unclassified Streptomyces]|uniref:S1C family serine protease n=1 Tax=unclassified Streptomyces TaxID=2593676 RepID=UPI003870BA3A